jgi:acetyl-CoA decarbonylase/synthase complex subunit epsilon
MAKPYQKANVPGPESGTTVHDPKVMANILKAPKKKLFIIGAEALSENMTIDEKPVIEYYVEIAKKIDCPVIATGHAYKYLKEHIDEDKLFDISLINITNRLSDEDWNGLDGEGQYKMAIFGGHQVFYSSQALSRLKNFTNWLRTIELDKYAHPNARFSLPNFNNKEWGEFLKNLIENL